jgi:hypothetical protein
MFRSTSLDQDPPMEASKWLKLQVLLDTVEMDALIKELGPIKIVKAGAVVAQGEEVYSPSEFQSAYQQYIDALKTGKLPAETIYRAPFSASFSLSDDCFCSIPVDGNRVLIRTVKPVLQLQPHSLDYSPHDKKFRPMVFGLDSVSWGLQFSYPQFFLDPKTKAPLQVDESADFPNTILFKKVQRWLRSHSIPTPFLVDQSKINVPMRLGNSCFSWINLHPQILQKPWRVVCE